MGCRKIYAGGLRDFIKFRLVRVNDYVIVVQIMKFIHDLTVVFSGSRFVNSSSIFGIKHLM